jgi:topoisomerase IA-like protein
MANATPRFFLKLPEGYFDMTPEQQKAAHFAMWQDAMRQMGRDPETGEKLESSAGTDSIEHSSAT